MPSALPPPTARLTASEPATVVDHATRHALGLHWWVDGTMGFLRRNGRTTVISPNGAGIARHVLTAADDFTRGLECADSKIADTRSRIDHASGGPLFLDDESGRLLLVYHGERFADGNPDDFYAFLGMAVSDDDGATFTDLGTIITPEIAEDDPERPIPLDVGAGPYITRDGWFCVYFQERGGRPGTRHRNLLVARAPVEEVLAAGRRGDTPIFSKYHDGRFAESGIGGKASELLERGRLPVLWFDTAWVDRLDAQLLVYSTVEKQADGSHAWNHAFALSRDGLHWSERTCLYETWTPDELLYVTIDSAGPEQRRITDNTFDLYLVRSSTRYRWDDATLEKVVVTVQPIDGDARAD